MPIIFLHGWTMDHRDETPVYEPIFAKRRGLSAHLSKPPRHGKKPCAVTRIKNQDDYLEVALRFIAAMTRRRKRFLLAGTSAGAYLARGGVQRLADRMDGLLLRVPLMVAADKQRDVPKFVPCLSRMRTSWRASSDADRETYAQILVHSPHYLKAARASRRNRSARHTKAADAKHLEPIRRDPSRYGFSFDADLLGEALHGADTDRDRPARHDCRLSRCLAGCRELSTRDLRRSRSRRSRIADRPGRALRALVNDWLDRVEEARDASRRA